MYRHTLAYFPLSTPHHTSVEQNPQLYSPNSLASVSILSKIDIAERSFGGTHRITQSNTCTRIANINNCIQGGIWRWWYVRPRICSRQSVLPSGWADCLPKRPHAVYLSMMEPEDWVTRGSLCGRLVSTS